MCQSDNGSITDESALRRWSNMYIQAHDDLKDLRAPLRLQNMFHTAGLTNVESRMIPLPLCGWSTGKLTMNFINVYQWNMSFSIITQNSVRNMRHLTSST